MAPVPQSIPSYGARVPSTSDFTCSHLSLTNGRGRHQGDLPRLLRRMATEIAKLGPDTMILDFVVHDEIDDLGPFFTATVYYSLNGWSDETTS